MNLIVAIDEQNAIGKGGGLLCHLSADLKHFKALTTGHTVVMGSRTYLSLPRRPLPDRRNIVLTRQDAALFEGAEVARSVEDIVSMDNQNNPNFLSSQTDIDNEIFIIGGGQVYEQMLPYADRLYVTRIHYTFPDADTFFPAIAPARWRLVSTESFPADDKNPYGFSFEEYERTAE
ncbi:MAG: dihydrofolate reductase [Paludibacteraceae bacterium]|nr:dihydrofolate reductase [Paludibacteraceae bacterium]